MRSLRALLLAVFAISLIAAGAAAGESRDDATPQAQAAAPSAGPLAVGAPITVKKPVKIAELVKSPDRFVGKTVLLDGTVKAVCQGRGCWVEVQDAKGAAFMAKSVDHGVLLPKDCAGRKIQVQGVVLRQAAQGHEQCAHAEGEAHAGGDAAGHSCPTPTYLVSTLGAKLK
jgi:hypothetical protein